MSPVFTSKAIPLFSARNKTKQGISAGLQIRNFNELFFPKVDQVNTYETQGSADCRLYKMFLLQKGFLRSFPVDTGYSLLPSPPPPFLGINRKCFSYPCQFCAIYFVFHIATSIKQTP